MEFEPYELRIVRAIGQGLKEVWMAREAVRAYYDLEDDAREITRRRESGECTENHIALFEENARQYAEGTKRLLAAGMNVVHLYDFLKTNSPEAAEALKGPLEEQVDKVRVLTTNLQNLLVAKYFRLDGDQKA